MKLLQRTAIISATPVNGWGGSWIRTFKVLPHILELFERDDVHALVVPSCSGIRWLIASVARQSYDFEQVYRQVRQDVLGAVKISTESTELASRILDYAFELGARDLRSNEFLRTKVMRFAPLLLRFISELEHKCLVSWKGLHALPASEELVAYCMDGYYEQLTVLERIAEMHKKTKIGVMLQGEPYVRVKHLPISLRPGVINNALYNMEVERLYRRLVDRGNLQLLLSVSKAPLVNSGLGEVAAKQRINVGIPRPGNAFDREILRHRIIGGKAPKAVFYARLTPGKGIYELPYIWRRANEIFPQAQLVVMGRFDDQRFKEKFFDLVHRLNLRNVSYLGYLRPEKLFEEVSTCRVLIYPSHEDSFSLAVLESLALGLGVVAYDIPAIKSVYGNIPAVSQVKEGDVEAMGRMAATLLMMDDRKLERLQEEEGTKHFLELHSSWEKVAEAEYTKLKLLFRESQYLSDLARQSNS